ncbi:DoxX family protein [Streptomyces profundus]|uniref:DoxX family protein n=1 Tax=Streptomyces profundus TaxID=2867410 RepID=UPI001D164CB5|nr:DoxX family protein [Streptomyces sp. MA3_2.13]UED82771.1 DoxX family protein [Streptomyces sp. MA3_2.13]
MRTFSPAARRRWLTGLCGWMVFSFTVGALTKFSSGETFFGPAYSEKFVDWGYPSWFRFVVGGGELLGAALLLRVRTRWWGAGLLLVITSGAVVTHVAHLDPVGESLSAPLHVVLSALLVWVYRPAGTRGRRPVASGGGG